MKNITFLVFATITTLLYSCRGGSNGKGSSNKANDVETSELSLSIPLVLLAP